MPEGSISLQWQSGDQIQMNVDIMPCVDLLHDLPEKPDIHMPVDLPYRFLIGRLYADLKLYSARSELIQKPDLLLIQNISGDLKMEIGDAIVMRKQIFPDLHGMFFITVKGTVYEFYLCHLLIKEKLQFTLHNGKIPQPDLLIDGRQAVAAAERTAAARLIIQDLVFKLFQIVI